ncbi:hypothetical protein DEU37_1899 [Microbacterium sp. AG790]|uniref:hypothetical protein n=1 Tax=Microbacterium sp. AG790 TaxID=2183995 RepID=UPI000EAE2D1D|nr:hypothetical protein [Microbacterium sp. AG790]RKS89582.1 hypothetical protein DEU37_1899 [Microbacterium sp. AG790]
MNTEDFQDRANAILQRMTPHSQAMWSNLSFASGFGDASAEMLSRLVLLTGAEEPVVVDAKVEDENGPTGFLLVVTATSIVKATFTTVDVGGFPRLETVVEGIPRSSVAGVRVHRALVGQPQREWPRAAQIEIMLDRALLGESTITVPAFSNSQVDFAAIRDLAATLIRG